MAPRLTRKGLLGLRIGMSEPEVIALVGPPLAKHPPTDPKRDPNWTWVYGKPGLLETGIEIGVGMQAGRLMSAGAELHDLGVYWCRRDACPVVRDEEALGCLP